MIEPRKSVTLCGCELDEPGHICAFFDSKAEQYAILAPYYKEGIDQGERVITIVDEAEVGDHRARMEAHGISVQEALSNGSLRVYASEDTYTSGGGFTAERMYDLLQNALATARRGGWRVRTSGVMDWAYRGHAGTEELMEYEARVNVLLPIYDCTLLCVYDLDRLNARTMMDILATHPFVIHRRQILKNPYYRPPVELLEEMLLTPPVGLNAKVPVQA